MTQHEHCLFIQITDSQIQKDFHNAIPFKEKVYYDSEKGICQECIWEHLRANKLPYLKIDNFFVFGEDCQMICKQWKQELKSKQTYYFLDQAKGFNLVLQTTPIDVDNLAAKPN